MWMSEFEVRPAEANRWWQQNSVIGVILNRLMILFIFAPIGLVFWNYLNLSMVVFGFMIPYGFGLRYLAVRAVRQYLQAHPDELESFVSAGIVNS